MHRRGGFSLIELMIVVLIVAILGAVAIPNYRSYILRTHRTDATRVLLDLAGRQERYFFSNNAYTDNIADLGGKTSMAGDRYTVSIPSASSTDYTVKAVAIGDQLNDKDCKTMSLDRTGEQHSTGTTDDNPKCWGN